MISDLVAERIAKALEALVKGNSQLVIEIVSFHQTITKLIELVDGRRREERLEVETRPDPVPEVAATTAG